MEIALVILLATTCGAFLYRAVLSARFRALIRDDEQDRRRLLARHELRGRPILAEWSVRSMRSDQESGELSRYRVRVPNVLPSWVTLYWEPSGSLLEHGSPPDDTGAERGNLFPRILFGSLFRSRPPYSPRPAVVVISDAGDLVVETSESPSEAAHWLFGPPPAPPGVEAFAAELAELCLKRSERLEELLVEDMGRAVRQGHAPDPDALRVLVQRFPGSSRTAEVVRDSLKSENAELRLIAALALGAEASGEVERIARTPSICEDTRRAAIRALIRRGDEQSLLGALADAPSGVETILLEALGKNHSEAIETATLRLLESKDSQIVEAAADVLARIGTRICVPLLRAARSRRITASARGAIDVALDLVLDRVGPSRSGGLAIVETGGDRGALSGVGESTGAVSEVPRRRGSTPGDSE